MASNLTPQLFAGVIEGFYGPPWSPSERRHLLDWMVQWGLDTYCYAPKDDLKHRTLWRELYASSETEILRELIASCQQHSLEFIYAIGPGLDIRYHEESDSQHLRLRCEQLLQIGCRRFLLCFDDIPDRLDPADLKRWGSLASAQCHVTNRVYRWILERQPQAQFIFCPTPYCGRMAARDLGGTGYLDTIGRELLPEIDVCWTGPEIISQEITVAHVRELQTVLRRKPVIWDNLHANDYDGRRFYCGPYAGRPLELKQEVKGLLLNPNTEFPLNYVPLRTFGEFVHSPGPWDARTAYVHAMQEWHAAFATVTQAVTLEDLILFGDCFYLPYTFGPTASALYHQARWLLTHPPAEWGEKAIVFRQHAARLRDFCVRLTELQQRTLFYSLSRRLWELREEIDLFDRYVASKSKAPNAALPVRSDYHLPGTYRGGFVAELQRLLQQKEDESWVPTQHPAPAPPAS